MVDSSSGKQFPAFGRRKLRFLIPLLLLLPTELLGDGIEKKKKQREEEERGKSCDCVCVLARWLRGKLECTMVRQYESDGTGSTFSGNWNLESRKGGQVLFPLLSVVCLFFMESEEMRFLTTDGPLVNPGVFVSGPARNRLRSGLL